MSDLSTDGCTGHRRAAYSNTLSRTRKKNAAEANVHNFLWKECARWRKIINSRGHGDRSGENGISFLNTDYREIKRQIQEKEERLSGEKHFKGWLRGKNGESCHKHSRPTRKQRKPGSKQLLEKLARSVKKN